MDVRLCITKYLSFSVHMKGACFSRILIMFIMILFWLSILESHIHQISKLSKSYNQLYLLTIKRHLSINFLVFILLKNSSIRCILNTLICIHNGKLPQLKKKNIRKNRIINIWKCHFLHYKNVLLEHLEITVAGNVDIVWKITTAITSMEAV